MSLSEIPSELLDEKKSMDYKNGDPSKIDGYQRRILTGMRPSGNLHLGHYVGALKNWLDFQDKFDCTFLLADLHALADHMEKPDFVRQSIRNVVGDWLSVGIDPEKANFTVQTGVPELENLTVLFETLVPLSVLQRNPTLKAELARMEEGQKTVSFHNYPVSEAADILGPLGDLVPAGDDQRPMIELTRSIARRFNTQFGKEAGFKFALPQIYTGTHGRLSGTDGNEKMGKTLNNAIFLTDSTDVVRKKVRSMKSSTKGLQDPGNSDAHLVFTYLDAFASDRERLKDLKARYDVGGVGEGEVKKFLEEELEIFLRPIREKRAEVDANPQLIEDTIATGTKRTRLIVAEVSDRVRHAMGLFNAR